MTRKFLLPAGLDQQGRYRACRELVIKFDRKGLVTTGYVLDVYPDERGWVDHPGNIDDSTTASITHHIRTRRAKPEDRNEAVGYFFTTGRTMMVNRQQRSGWRRIIGLCALRTVRLISIKDQGEGLSGAGLDLKTALSRWHRRISARCIW